MKKELTKKQRREIYLKAAIHFLLPKKKRPYMKSLYTKISGFCDYIESEYDISDCNLFPEYQLFRPDWAGTYTYWWNNDEERIIALLLAYELTF